MRKGIGMRTEQAVAPEAGWHLGAPPPPHRAGQVSLGPRAPHHSLRCLTSWVTDGAVCLPLCSGALGFWPPLATRSKGEVVLGLQEG